MHSATGFSGYAASDRVPEQIAAMVYVDTAPGKGALDPGFEGDEKPMVWEEIQAEENLDGLSDEQIATFRERAVPVPASLIREGHEFTNDARRDIPSTIIATGYTAEAYQQYAREDPVPAFLAGLPELRNITWIDLPTSHWPMWSRPADIARIIGDVARGASPALTESPVGPSDRARRRPLRSRCPPRRCGWPRPRSRCAGSPRASRGCARCAPRPSWARS